MSALRYIIEECPVQFRSEEFHDPLHFGTAAGDGIFGQDLSFLWHTGTRVLLGRHHRLVRIHLRLSFMEVFRSGEC